VGAPVIDVWVPAGLAIAASQQGLFYSDNNECQEKIVQCSIQCLVPEKRAEKTMT
jgi:hypothetical protein